MSDWNPELFMLIFIPPLLCSATPGIWPPSANSRGLRGVNLRRWPSAFLSSPSVVFGYALHWLIPAVPAARCFRRRCRSLSDGCRRGLVDRRQGTIARRSMLHLLEGESLLNDASGLVIFRFAVAAAVTGAFSLADASGAFVFAVVAGGGCCGFACLGCRSQGIENTCPGSRRVRSEAQVLVLAILPFLAYLLAERFHASGRARGRGRRACSCRASGLVPASRRFCANAHALDLADDRLCAERRALCLSRACNCPAIIWAVPPELTNHHWFFQPVLVIGYR